ncbi:hypothetical protein GCM10027299_51950 [Larkinella ripae]
MNMFTLSSRSGRKKFICTVYAKDGTQLASRVYNAFDQEGARMQLEEWLDVHAESIYDPDRIHIELVKK